MTPSRRLGPLLLLLLLGPGALGCCCGTPGLKGVGLCPPPGGCSPATCEGSCEPVSDPTQCPARGARAGQSSHQLELVATLPTRTRQGALADGFTAAVNPGKIEMELGASAVVAEGCATPACLL